MDNQVEEIKQKTDIVDLIGSYINLKKAGASYKATCPFHNEKDPSFIVNPNRQIFKCFGCGKGGDVYSFVQEIEGVDFPGALKLLADRAGVRLKEIDERHYQNTKELYQINELAAKFYQYVLVKDKLGKKALEYLIKERCLKDEIIEKFRIGYAPKAWDNLIKFLIKKGFSQKKIVEAGLAVETKTGNRIYDRFRGRIMVPILSPADRVIGFTSRILPQFDDGKMGKYINSPETPIFNKSRTLFGKNFADKAIRENGRAIMVEGQFDVISSYQNGFENTIATSGTSLTKEQIDLISRVAKEIIFAFDSDQAGQTATSKGIDLALASNLEVKVAIIPGKFGDVDDVLRADPKLWEKSIKNSEEVINYYFNRLVPENAKDLSANKKRLVVGEIVAQISKTNDPIVEGDWLNRLAEALDIDEQFIGEALASYRKKESKITGRPANQGSHRVETAQTTNFQRRLLALMMTFENLSDSIKEEFDLDLIEDEKLRRLYQSFKKGKLSSSQKDLVDGLILEIEKDYPDKDFDIAREEISQLISRVKTDKKEKLKSEYAQKIKEAEKLGDIKKLQKLIEKFQEIIK